MNYYQKNREKISKKAHEKYHNGNGKEQAKKYYRENKEEIKKRERKGVKNWTGLKRKTK